MAVGDPCTLELFLKSGVCSLSMQILWTHDAADQPCSRSGRNLGGPYNSDPAAVTVWLLQTRIRQVAKPDGVPCQLAGDIN